MPRAVRWIEPYNVARFDDNGNFYINEADHKRLKEFYNSKRLEQLYEDRQVRSTGILPWSDWKESGSRKILYRGKMDQLREDPSLVNVADPRRAGGYNSNGMKVSRERWVYQPQAWSPLDDEVAIETAWERCLEKWGKSRPASKLIVMEMWKEDKPISKIAQSINSSESYVYRLLGEGRRELEEAFRQFVNEQ